MTKAERADIGRLVRLRAKVSRNEVDATKAERLAAFEEELARRVNAQSELVRDIVAEASAEIGRLDEKLAQRWRELGWRDEFRPSLTYHYWSRGENAVESRRTELRAVARTRADADAKAARHRIDVWESDTTTRLISSGLDSGEARAFLDSLPSADQLMPALAIAELEAEVGTHRGLG